MVLQHLCKFLTWQLLDILYFAGITVCVLFSITIYNECDTRSRTNILFLGSAGPQQWNSNMVAVSILNLLLFTFYWHFFRLWKLYVSRYHILWKMISISNKDRQHFRNKFLTHWLLPSWIYFLITVTDCWQSCQIGLKFHFQSIICCLGISQYVVSVFTCSSRVLLTTVTTCCPESTLIISTILDCDRQTDRQTSCCSIYCTVHRIM